MVNEQGNAPTTGQRITPADIQRQEFGVSRFGGYRMRDVDEFLDRLTESTEILVAENERLRVGGSPIVGTSDLDDVNRQADEIVERARAEAARILEEARGRAAAAGPDVPLDEAQRATVEAFLGQERAFLQSLATLVQGHAESVKAMAKQARRASAQPTTVVDTTDADASEIAESEADAGDTDPREDDGGEISLPEAGEDADENTSNGMEEGGGDETVILEVPQPTTMGAERERDSSDPSLRQLFWGEEQR
jgi:DivIVA domain-containing protein